MMCSECGNLLEAGQHALCLSCTGDRWRAENPQKAADLRDAQEELADRLENL